MFVSAIVNSVNNGKVSNDAGGQFGLLEEQKGLGAGQGEFRRQNSLSVSQCKQQAPNVSQISASNNTNIAVLQNNPKIDNALENNTEPHDYENKELTASQMANFERNIAQLRRELTSLDDQKEQLDKEIDNTCSREHFQCTDLLGTQCMLS